jgi:hypothetical protein
VLKPYAAYEYLFPERQFHHRSGRAAIARAAGGFAPKRWEVDGWGNIRGKAPGRPYSVAEGAGGVVIAPGHEKRVEPGFCGGAGLSRLRCSVTPREIGLHCRA